MPIAIEPNRGGFSPAFRGGQDSFSWGWGEYISSLAIFMDFNKIGYFLTYIWIHFHSSMHKICSYICKCIKFASFIQVLRNHSFSFPLKARNIAQNVSEVHILIQFFGLDTTVMEMSSREGNWMQLKMRHIYKEMMNVVRFVGA